ncbi:extensin-like [Hordeum vulgare subsp. vulgare]|uniref:extensin-like n=1 Tax=Hordeum vulgare subsp. vulgare TaxID=112509 RepID=UPI00162C625C|nr:extensin-like [Hordeum vulgare subsp. vulgare]
MTPTHPTFLPNPSAPNPPSSPRRGPPPTTSCPVVADHPTPSRTAVACRPPRRVPSCPRGSPSQRRQIPTPHTFPRVHRASHPHLHHAQTRLDLATPCPLIGLWLHEQRGRPGGPATAAPARPLARAPPCLRDPTHRHPGRHRAPHQRPDPGSRTYCPPHRPSIFYHSLPRWGRWEIPLSQSSASHDRIGADDFGKIRRASHRIQAGLSFTSVKRKYDPEWCMTI